MPVLCIKYYCGDQVRVDEVHRTNIACRRKEMRAKYWLQNGERQLGET
jgi:hypothetical protein